MHIVIVGPVPPPYQGMTVYTGMLLAELERAGVAVRWIDSSDHRDLSNMGRIDFGNLWGAARTSFGILGAVSLERPRLLYLPIAQSRLPFIRDAIHLMLGRMLGMRTVVHLHGGNLVDFYSSQPAWMQRLMRWSLDACAAIVVLTPSLTAEFDGIVRRPALRVVPNAVAPVLDPAAISARSATLGSRPVCVSFLAAITGPKGAVDFVRAVEALPESVRARANFVIAGNRDGNFEDDFRLVDDAVRRLAAAGTAIALEGVVDAEGKARFFGGTDVFVLPSHREGQPLVLLEALSAGCAVVSTTVGGIPETVTHAEDGLLTAPGDIEALAGALRELIDDPARTVALGERGRARWESCYQPGVHAEAMIGVLESALGCPMRDA